MIFRNEPENVNRQAADWLARLHADDRTDHDEAMFSHWLAANPRHADAFERASNVWDLIGGLPHEAAARPQQSVSRRAVLAGAAGLVFVGASTFTWRNAMAREYQTDIGEQRRVLLEDGSRLMLDTATHISFRAEAEVRSLVLFKGRIDLEIAADARPFVIDGGTRRAYARQARLDVRRDGDELALTAISGFASVAAGDEPVVVAVGERIAIKQGQPDKVDLPELEDLTAWQSGRLAFRNETLATAVSEMNRYSERPLVIADESTAALRLSGVYRVGNPEAFAQSLAVLLSIEVQATPDLVRLSSAS